MGLFSEYRQVNLLLQQKQTVVFYSEGRQYYVYFEKLVEDLLSMGTQVTYITSDSKDPLLSSAPAGMKVIYVKWMLGFLFAKLRASVVIMTMPDLDNYLFKRSPAVDHYVYMFHAAVSTHQQYREKAFFNYDAIFCTGEYQHQEIRATEKLHELNEKQLVAYGYPLIDKIKSAAATRLPNDKTTILVAPSWFDGCIFDTCIEELLQELSKLPYKVIVRSHPEYKKRNKRSFKRVQQLVASSPGITLDYRASVLDSIEAADLLITDRSGIAFEFAFGKGQPVLFIDTALKEVNKDWSSLGIDPIENSVRTELGLSLLPSQLGDLPTMISELLEMHDSFSKKIEVLEKAIFYNSTATYKQGCDYVINKLAQSS